MGHCGLGVWGRVVWVRLEETSDQLPWGTEDLFLFSESFSLEDHPMTLSTIPMNACWSPILLSNLGEGIALLPNLSMSCELFCIFNYWVYYMYIKPHLLRLELINKDRTSLNSWWGRNCFLISSVPSPFLVPVRHVIELGYCFISFLLLFGAIVPISDPSVSPRWSRVGPPNQDLVKSNWEPFFPSSSGKAGNGKYLKAILHRAWHTDTP